MFKGKHGKEVTKFIVNDDFMVNAIMLFVNFLCVNLIDHRSCILIPLVVLLVCRVFEYFKFFGIFLFLFSSLDI